MQADVVRRRVAEGLAAVLIAASFVVASPVAPQAEADAGWLTPCNAPGGKYVCDKAEKGAKWLYDKSGTDSLVDGVVTAADFATDPLGYIEGKVRAGAQGLFQAFGEELTGEKIPPPGSKSKTAEPKRG
ncbi:hypothetical protein ACFU8W_48470 [Streptomyces sp. NPDC057565]|uniref:hypothetical protein n=1 Tax=Streptomyces sp. NPDC057565 TaxID=3346169 RepID=UPI0036ABA71C